MGDDLSGRESSAARPLWVRVVILLAAIGFVLGLYLSYRAQPDLLANPNWGSIALVAIIGVPVILILNALELQVSANLIGQQFSFSQAAEVTVIGSAANMLPLPGGTMVRVAALKIAGASLKRSSAVTLLVSGLWVGIAFIYSGIWICSLEITSLQWGFLFIAGGIAAFLVCVVLSIRLSKKPIVLGQLTLIKLALVVVDATRIFVCFLALGYSASYAQASALAVSSVMGAAVSVVPAGLGIREGVAALLGPVVALSAASAFLAASLNRIIGLAVIVPVALFLGLRRKRSS